MDALLDRGWIPDALLRIGVRRLLVRRLRAEDPGTDVLRARAVDAWARVLRESPVALAPDAANAQHYEVPAAFFRLVLGRRLKYSAAHFAPGAGDLDSAEEAMLALTCERARLEDGQDVLELGCGWGSLTLWMAEHYPNSRVTAVSNSRSQRAFIEERAAEHGRKNVRVLTRDVNDLDLDGRFDRVVSVEMFEHVRNYAELLRRIAAWLRDDGALFVHVFAHRALAYPFETDGADNWLGRHFFTGGQMPSRDLLHRFQEHMRIEAQWWEDGTHYARTSEAWLERLDQRRDEVLAVLAETHGAPAARAWLHRWRLFFIACAELFAFRDGSEWGVAHYRMRKAEAP